MRKRRFFSPNKKFYNSKKKYSSRKLENPYFKNKHKLNYNFLFSILIFLRKRLTFFVISIIILAGGYFLFFSNYFEIKNINISGISRVSSEEIGSQFWEQADKTRWLLFSQKNILLFNENDFIDKLYSKYGFNKAELEKKYPETINIDIQEKSFAYIWEEGDNKYYADIDNYIISEINLLETGEKTFPYIYNAGSDKINDNIISISDDKINAVFHLFEKFSVILNDYHIEKFIINDENETVILQTKEGPQINFSSKNDIEVQLNNLIVLKNNKLNGDISNLEYIELRYGERIFYR